jgi:plasmid stability protein
MKDIAVNHLPDHLYEQLSQRAARNRRSINNEITVLLEQALQAEMNNRYDAQELLAEARKLRQHFNVSTPTIERHPRSWRQR